MQAPFLEVLAIELQDVGKELQVGFCIECCRLITVVILFSVVRGLAHGRRSNQREDLHRFHGGGNVDVNRGFTTARRVHANVMGLFAAPAVIHLRPTRTTHFFFNLVLHELHEHDRDVDRSGIEYK